MSVEKSLWLLLIALSVLAACGASPDSGATEITLYKSPTCSCCGNWADYLIENGFTVNEVLTDDLEGIKDQYGVPPELRSCHTAVVEGYVIEGHVPVKEINRLLSDRLDVTGIAVAGMPIGSPGMEVEDLETQAYDVVLFGPSGEVSIYASYP